MKHFIKLFIVTILTAVVMGCTSVQEQPSYSAPISLEESIERTKRSENIQCAAIFVYAAYVHKRVGRIGMAEEALAKAEAFYELLPQTQSTMNAVEAKADSLYENYRGGINQEMSNAIHYCSNKLYL